MTTLETSTGGRTEDAELLRRYASERSEVAFAELVRRHLAPVYGFALRRVGGDAHLAEDVAQEVFTALARKAGALADRPVLGGWLCRTTHYAARDVVRADRRRRTREQEAFTMDETLRDDAAASVEWEKLQPLLAETMGELNDADRDAVWLRFFEGRSFAEVGVRLRLTENTARMRVERALDKLHAALAKRGVTSTTAALGIALANQAAAAVPAGLAASVTGAALAGVTAVGAGGTMVFMGTIKFQLGVAGALAMAGTAGWVVQTRADTALKEEVVALRQQTSGGVAEKLREENARLAVTRGEVERWRKDHAELARLRAEIDAVKLGQRQQARAEAEARAKRAAELAAMPVYAEAQVDEQPKAKFQGGMTIPQSVREQGKNASARVSYVVNVDGGVSDVTVLSSTNSEWSRAVTEGVKQWQFAPARKGGEAVNVRRELPMEFSVEKQPSKNGRRFWF